MLLKCEQYASGAGSTGGGLDRWAGDGWQCREGVGYRERVGQGYREPTGSLNLSQWAAENTWVDQAGEGAAGTPGKGMDGLYLRPVWTRRGPLSGHLAEPLFLQ